MQATSLRPLSGVRILITRPIEQASVLSDKLRHFGATTVQLPTIEIVPAEDTAALDVALRNLTEYSWIIFTSVHGVEFFVKRMVELSIPPEVLRKVRVAAIGPATARALEGAVKKPDYVPIQYLSEKIIGGLGDVKGMRILLPRADIASKTLPTILRDRGALVDELVVYRTVTPQDLTTERLTSILADGLDLVTFTSPSTIRNLAHIVGDKQLANFMRNVKVACIGPVTVAAARGFGIKVDIVARSHTVDSLVEAIVNEIGTV